MDRGGTSKDAANSCPNIRQQDALPIPLGESSRMHLDRDAMVNGNGSYNLFCADNFGANAFLHLPDQDAQLGLLPFSFLMNDGFFGYTSNINNNSNNQALTMQSPLLPPASNSDLLWMQNPLLINQLNSPPIFPQDMGNFVSQWRSNQSPKLQHLRSSAPTQVGAIHISSIDMRSPVLSASASLSAARNFRDQPNEQGEILKLSRFDSKGLENILFDNIPGSSALSSSFYHLHQNHLSQALKIEGSGTSSTLLFQQQQPDIFSDSSVDTDAAISLEALVADVAAEETDIVDFEDFNTASITIGLGDISEITVFENRRTSAVSLCFPLFSPEDSMDYTFDDTREMSETTETDSDVMVNVRNLKPYQKEKQVEALTPTGDKFEIGRQSQKVQLLLDDAWDEADNDTRNQTYTDKTDKDYRPRLEKKAAPRNHTEILTPNVTKKRGRPKKIPTDTSDYMHANIKKSKTSVEFEKFSLESATFNQVKQEVGNGSMATSSGTNLYLAPSHLICHHCYRGPFATINSLRTHMRQHEPGKEIFTCAVCKREFVRAQDLKRHDFTHRKIENTTAMVEIEKAPSVAQMYEKTISCELCGKGLNSLLAYSTMDLNSLLLDQDLDEFRFPSDAGFFIGDATSSSSTTTAVSSFTSLDDVTTASNLMLMGMLDPVTPISSAYSLPSLSGIAGCDSGTQLQSAEAEWKEIKKPMFECSTCGSLFKTKKVCVM
ncbi:hypothetical protein HK100_003472 [Physocladia obscura]|uniref:C2H2-type domain-containing protein n=1 Tax=Physocladia obscura TaxID=109957 RepID=A0AAD5TCQ0_9FUNG|nr:hypothetical protein HK100_003472 [Physocladia obscura]